MRGFWRRKYVVPVVTAFLAACAACNKNKDSGPAAGGPPGGFGPGGGQSSPIRDIMNKLTKGPGSLTGLIGGELKQVSPPWDTIQTQAKEFSQLASTMGKYDPPKGSKESWAELTKAYADSAVALDKAAQEKNKEAAMTAHTALAGSCMACHKEHRMGGPGGGGPPGGFPPGRGPPGGPPPGQ